MALVFKNGYRFKYAGENLAVNFSDSAEVERAWMNSPGHRANILNGKFTEVGIAISFGKYDGRDVVFVAQLFGRPSLAAAATAPIARALASETKTAAPAGTPITEQTVRVLSEEISTGDTGPENEIFVAVENASETDEVAAPAEETTAVNVGTNVSALQRLATMPQTTMRYAYFALIAVVLTALFLNIFIEIRRQHPRHILYGILLLVFIGALFTSVKHLSSLSFWYCRYAPRFSHLQVSFNGSFRMAQNRNCGYITNASISNFKTKVGRAG